MSIATGTYDNINTLKYNVSGVKGHVLWYGGKVVENVLQRNGEQWVYMNIL